MTREWQPGDIALVRLDAETEVRAIRTSSGDWVTRTFAHYDPALSARPLVVIDPEDREQIERLYSLYEDVPLGAIDSMQAALRNLADPPSPRPDEPLGLGAVVEDGVGDLWVRLETGVWAYGGNAGGGVMWPELSAVRVLSPGYDPEATT